MPKNNAERLGGSLLIGYGLLSLVAIAHHPQVSAKLDDATTFARIAATLMIDCSGEGFVTRWTLLNALAALWQREGSRKCALDWSGF